ncbi:hypothetical protein [Synergistes jonesii]|uniref:Uncharacterized protein n=1 Tax=Synergistes jonesii TaxID=2754 RepID=A0A073ILP4_9BACT|nr:hypothetical protein [Synergistes jonesii]KEJ91248.1 hypothetical protein EH55_11900 [Synergistes jonesii]OFB60259.1 hypothetical protein JS73_12740 [Synergistes jonesii]OFB65638.1 hypothetical protein JS72_01315 [Synergistes jonesii]OFB66201.1 hypothetical protein JS79_03525 [Synergistes jonesii]OFB66536.1 hypothetical protein JS78_12760 [Synergistes jonesii]
MKRLTALLVFLMLAVMLAGGSGTAEDPYRIANAAELLAFATSVNDDTRYVRLISDIDLNGS